MMSSSTDTLQFRFPALGDSILSRMNALRAEHRFCDITLLLGGPQGATVRPLHFRGHRVVLAASSDFLRDQFLLHEGRSELSLGIVSSVEVGERLLLSCYTGLLEVPLRQLVSYLTAASALQMSQVVERCAQAVSQFLSPTLASLELETHAEEKEINFQTQAEKGAAEPSTSIQRASTKEVGEVVIQARVGRGAEADGRGMGEVRGDGGEVTPKTEVSEDAACCLTSEESGEILRVHTNTPLCREHHVTEYKLRPPAADASSTTTGISAKHEQPADSSQTEETKQEQEEEDKMFSLAAQLQKCGELMDSDLLMLPQDGASDSVLVQRPYLCRRCDRVFQHLESYVGHLKEHRQFLCLVCGKGFSQKSNLTRHVHVHTGVKPFRCPLCHRTFSQKATLQDHLNLHTGDQPHKCNYCAVHFAHKAGFRRHLKDIHGKSSLQNVLEEAVD